MRRLGGDDAPRWLFILAVIGLIVICTIAYRSQAQMPQDNQKYMLLYSGADGLNLDCVDEYPYTDVRRMDWNATDGFTEIDHYDHVLSIIAVESCNVDNVYTSEQGLFVWRFTDIECQRNRCAVHVNRGAWWIVPR